MAITRELFGTMPGGTEAYKYTLVNRNKVSASFITSGGVWVSMMVSDRKRQMGDVVFRYDDLDSYRKNPSHFGAPVGHNASRIGRAVLTIAGKEYLLAVNDGPNNLHSDPNLYHDRVWSCQASNTEQESRLDFHLESPDGDQGYPGSAKIMVSYTPTNDNSLILDYHMVCDADTVANFINHGYFNLTGYDSGDVLKQRARIDASYYTPADQVSIPIREIVPVAGTPMDSTEVKPTGRDIEAPSEALIFGKGYDHNWVLDHKAGELVLAARVMDPLSGHVMECYTNLPSIQFYTTNFLTDELTGKGGAHYDRRHAFCSETQCYPDTVHKGNLPFPMIKAGQEYKITVVYKFLVE